MCVWFVHRLGATPGTLTHMPSCTDMLNIRLLRGKLGFNRNYSIQTLRLYTIITVNRRPHGMTNERTYQNALEIIDSRRRQTRPKNETPDQKPDNPTPGQQTKSRFRGEPSIAGMAEWLSMLGHNQKDLDSLNVIHVAGTKGKGSTCAFVESILRAHGQEKGYPRKIGLYTSPHLIHPEERICINSNPLERDLFARYFFQVYDHLPQLAEPYDPHKPLVERGPRFAQLFTLFALHVFIREEVDVVVFETHSGGEYDPTNIIQRPVVTAITSLGMDHVEMLGPTIENIAWHKSGIFKAGAVALSAKQDAAPAEILKQRAEAKGEKVRFVTLDARIPPNSPQVHMAVQRENASLAIAAAEAFLKQTAQTSTHRELSTQAIQAGIHHLAWPGRFQTVVEEKCTWFLDAAHNEMSISIAAQWFAESSRAAHDRMKALPVRVLIFSHIHESRDVHSLLETLAIALKAHDAGLDHVVFTTYDESRDRKSLKRPAAESRFGPIWRNVYPNGIVRDEDTIQGAMEYAKSLGAHSEAHVLITGSQYLIGPALRVLQERGVKI
ncbi:Hypothetical protein R9X50_00497500 [Acrodontium crateriforme]|uniref:tetrahydrofolate synthase n=1 Tax=Acrodontium crateriforme TaxID=150365 RepID=A0AAQ3M743_9PEZI|nr:Hypothetical protein R9X50_00497500 [Acrodontium crateriforme]